LKIFFGGCVNVDKFLRVKVNQRKPAALYLNHNFVALPERVVHVVEFEAYFIYIIHDQRLGN
jgi:hypothetical protein